MGMLAIAVIVFILEYFLILNRLVKINTKKMQETIHAKECEYTTSLSADRFKIKNHATNDMGTIDYDDISGFIETKNYYVLFGTMSRKGTNLSKRTTRDKLLSFLSVKAVRTKNSRVEIPFNRQELADYLCVNRCALSQELSLMQKEGLLRHEKNILNC